MTMKVRPFSIADVAILAAQVGFTLDPMLDVAFRVDSPEHCKPQSP